MYYFKKNQLFILKHHQLLFLPIYYNLVYYHKNIYNIKKGKKKRKKREQILDYVIKISHKNQINLEINIWFYYVINFNFIVIEFYIKYFNKFSNLSRLTYDMDRGVYLSLNFLV